MTVTPDPATDPRADQYEAERQDLAAKIHKAMTSSYIGPPRPMLLGDADRAVAAVVTAGWIPGSADHTEAVVTELHAIADLIDRGPTIPLRPSIFSALIRERAADLWAAGGGQ